MSAATSAPLLDPVGVYRDDGPLARALGRLPRALVPLDGPALLLVAAAPLLALAAFADDDASNLAAGAALAWAIALGGASLARPGRPKSRWAEPPLLRTIEFAGLIWIAALEGSSALPAAFALLAVLTFRHYDLAYRLRQRGVTPARWLNLLSGGWEGRLLAAFALLLAGALPAGYYAAAAVLGVAFAAESVAGWLRGGGEVLLDDDEVEEVA